MGRCGGGECGARGGGVVRRVPGWRWSRTRWRQGWSCCRGTWRRWWRRPRSGKGPATCCRESSRRRPQTVRAPGRGGPAWRGAGRQ
eukprot:3095054-Prymnesium_polylepis.1